MVLCVIPFAACSQTDPDQAKAQEMTKSMSNEEKVGQLFIVDPDALVKQTTNAELLDTVDKSSVTEASPSFINLVKKYHLGGFVFFAKNLVNPDQTTAFLTKLQEESKVPLLFTIDEEGGQVARIANNPNFGVKNAEGGMQAVGKTGDANNAYNAAEYISSYLTKFKFNVDFAPVCDINPNVGQNSLKDRSFGEDPNEICDYVEQYIKGIHKNGIMATMKHFPGGYGEKGDQHKSSVVVNKTWDEVKTDYLPPFLRAMQNNVEFCMMGHSQFPKVTGDNIPASLSKEIITNKLRGELGYKGVILSDALNMEAVNGLFKSDEACVAALEAGNDMLLMPKNFSLAYDGLLKAVQDGRISQDTLDEHVTRILKTKINAGLI